MSKNPPSTDIDENFTHCSTSIGHSICFSFSVTLLSTYFSSSKSLIMTNASACSVVCLRRSLKVFSSPSPIVATRFNVSKISCSTSLPYLELSLLSWNAGGGFDASNSMYITSIALKTSFLTFCNSLSSSSFLYFFLSNFVSSCLLFISIDLKHSLPHFDATKNIRKSKVKKTFQRTC